jgi:hypothetical protein
MSNGIFSRLNATQVQNSGMGDGMIISVIGSMESTDGTTMSLRTSDGTSLQYAMPAEFDFVQGKIVEMMGAKNPESGMLDAFVARDLGADFDLNLYNEFLTKVLHSDNGRYKDYFFEK